MNPLELRIHCQKYNRSARWIELASKLVMHRQRDLSFGPQVSIDGASLFVLRSARMMIIAKNLWG
jgi:hypothetical protein